MGRTGRAKRGARAVTLVLLAAAFVAVTADVFVSGPLTRMDWTTHLYVQDQLGHSWWWWLASVLQRAGDERIALPALSVICLLVAWRYRSFRPLVLTFVVCVSIVIIVPAIKIGVGRTAPHTGVDWVLTAGREYPSGHAVNAIMLWGTFLELAASGSRRVARLLGPRRRYGIVALAAAAGGLGMLGLDYHWLTDVVAGWLLGAAMYVAALWIDPFRPLRQRRDAGLAPLRYETTELGTSAPGTSRYESPETSREDPTLG